MIATDNDRPSKDIDPTVPTDPVSGSIAARGISTHRVSDERGTVGSVGTVARTVPALFARFSQPSKPTVERESLSPLEEEEQSEHTDDDGPWIINAEAAAELDSLEEVDFNDVPVCSCGRYCDVQTLGDAWHCSSCDPNAEERRKRTQRLLASARRIRELN